MVLATIKKTGQQLSLFNTASTQPQSFDAFCAALKVSTGPGWADRFGKAIHTWSRNVLPQPITTLSLFSGAGGLDIAFHDSGFNIGTMIEIETKFVETLRANVGRGKYLGEALPLCCDIRNFQPEQKFKVDFIIGG